MKRLLKAIARLLPPVRRLLDERDRLRAKVALLEAESTFVPPGHFYSPIPDPREIERRAGAIFDRSRRQLPGIDLREEEQLALLRELAVFYKDQPFGPKKKAGLRYFFENEAYSYSDAILLHAMIRKLRPKRIVEVGSGHSSCAILDTNERFLGGSARVTFVEPHPALLESLVGKDELSRLSVRASPLQDIELSVFSELAEGDILFIDSTHVAKTGSDVNRVFFEILPALAKGVHVHFHDVFWPFEYPKEWVVEGRSWNEGYVLRAFLEFNDAFEIVLWNTFLETFHEDFFRKEMPLCLENRGGSIWIRRR